MLIWLPAFCMIFLPAKFLVIVYGSTFPWLSPGWIKQWAFFGCEWTPYFDFCTYTNIRSIFFHITCYIYLFLMMYRIQIYFVYKGHSFISLQPMSPQPLCFPGRGARSIWPTLWRACPQNLWSQRCGWPPLREPETRTCPDPDDTFLWSKYESILVHPNLNHKKIYHLLSGHVRSIYSEL